MKPGYTVCYEFLVEDCFGKEFFKRLFCKKLDENIFRGHLKSVKQIQMSPKISRIIKQHASGVDRIIIIMDSEGQPIKDKEAKLLGYAGKEYRKIVSIVLVDYEIEEWICYSLDIKPGGKKPSNVLKYEREYRKSQLPKYVDELDCKKLMGCGSFKRFASLLSAP